MWALAGNELLKVWRKKNSGFQSFIRLAERYMLKDCVVVNLTFDPTSEVWILDFQTPAESCAQQKAGRWYCYIKVSPERSIRAKRISNHSQLQFQNTLKEARGKHHCRTMRAGLELQILWLPPICWRRCHGIAWCVVWITRVCNTSFLLTLAHLPECPQTGTIFREGCPYS